MSSRPLSAFEAHATSCMAEAASFSRASTLSSKDAMQCSASSSGSKSRAGAVARGVVTDEGEAMASSRPCSFSSPGNSGGNAAKPADVTSASRSSSPSSRSRSAAVDSDAVRSASRFCSCNCASSFSTSSFSKATEAVSAAISANVASCFLARSASRIFAVARNCSFVATTVSRSMTSSLTRASCLAFSALW